MWRVCLTAISFNPAPSTPLEAAGGCLPPLEQQQLQWASCSYCLPAFPELQGSAAFAAASSLSHHPTNQQPTHVLLLHIAAALQEVTTNPYRSKSKPTTLPRVK